MRILKVDKDSVQVELTSAEANFVADLLDQNVEVMIEDYMKSQLPSWLAGEFDETVKLLGGLIGTGLIDTEYMTTQLERETGKIYFDPILIPESSLEAIKTITANEQKLDRYKGQQMN